MTNTPSAVPRNAFAVVSTLPCSSPAALAPPVADDLMPPSCHLVDTFVAMGDKESPLFGARELCINTAGPGHLRRNGPSPKGAEFLADGLPPGSMARHTEQWRMRPTSGLLLIATLLVALIGATPVHAQQAPAREGSPPPGPTAAQTSTTSEASGGRAAAVEEDARLAQRIEQRLAWDRELAPFDLNVRVEDAIVHLSGHVATMPQSHRARQLAEAEPGADAVVNATYVDPALAVARSREPQRPDDTTLRARVEEILRHDRRVEGSEIGVDVQDSVVTLTGTVGDVGSRQNAVRVVRDLYGVERVVDELKVARAEN